MRFLLGRHLCATLFLVAIAAACQQVADPVVKARSLVEAGRLAAAEQTLDAFLRASPSSADGHFLLGSILFRERKARESLAEYTAGAKFRRPAPSDLKTVAFDYVMLGDYDDAAKWLSEVVAETPDDSNAWYLLGRAQYNEREMQAAAQSFEHALRLRPKDVEAENNLGLCLKELDRRDEARAAFEAAIEWQGTTPTDAQPMLNLGTLLAEQSKWDDALPYLVRAAALAPQNAAVREALADVYSAQHEYGKAKSEYERAIAIAPDVSALHYKLGRLLRKQGQTERADTEFQICAKLSGTQSSRRTPNPPAEEQASHP